MNTNQLPFVQIFMCTFNGDKFIEDQLQSIETQTYLNWKLIVSDDGSRDRTLKILFEYQKKWSAKKIEIVKGPRLGFSANFLSLIQNKKYKADYFFLSDQDDVWHPKKIEDYLYNFTKLKKDVPQLIGGRTVYVNEDLFLLGESINYTHPHRLKIHLCSQCLVAIP